MKKKDFIFLFIFQTIANECYMTNIKYSDANGLSFRWKTMRDSWPETFFIWCLPGLFPHPAGRNPAHHEKKERRREGVVTNANSFSLPPSLPLSLSTSLPLSLSLSLSPWSNPGIKSAWHTCAKPESWPHTRVYSERNTERKRKHREKKGNTERKEQHREKNA